MRAAHVQLAWIQVAPDKDINFAVKGTLGGGSNKRPPARVGPAECPGQAAGKRVLMGLRGGPPFGNQPAILQPITVKDSARTVTVVCVRFLLVACVKAGMDPRFLEYPLKTAHVSCFLPRSNASVQPQRISYKLRVHTRRPYIAPLIHLLQECSVFFPVKQVFWSNNGTPSLLFFSFFLFFFEGGSSYFQEVWTTRTAGFWVSRLHVHLGG